EMIVKDATAAGGFEAEIKAIQELVQTGTEALAQAEETDKRLSKHKELEQEAKELKARIKATENRKLELAEAARVKIKEEEAKEAILNRLHRRLLDAYNQYLRADQRACVAAVENLWSKYAVT